MAMSGSDIRSGQVLVVDGEPCRVIDFQHVQPGKGPAYMQTKLRNVQTGVIFDQRFRATDQVERGYVDTQELQFLYKGSLHYHFMNTETYEMSVMDDNMLGDAAKWLVPNKVIEAEFYEGKPIGVKLPKTLDLTVTETAPGVKGDTKTSVTKPATLENGVTVQVPAFINVDDVVRVDPGSGEYLERVR